LQEFKLYPEELFLCSSIALNDINFIKNITHFHPLQLPVIYNRLENPIFELINERDKIYHITGKYTKLYRCHTMSVVVGMCRITEGESFYKIVENHIDNDQLDFLITKEEIFKKELTTEVIEEMLELSQRDFIVRYWFEYINVSKVFKHLPQNDANNEMQSKVLEELTKMAESQQTPRPGPRKKHLFLNEDGEWDEKRTKEEAERVKNYISTHRLGTKKQKLNSSKISRINIIVASFWHHWNDKKLVDEKFAGAAFYRFLTVDCGLECDVEEKTFIQTIRTIISDRRNPEIFAKVADSFENQ
jgi:hypothetical protein